MTLVLQKGRPADTTGRLDKEIRTYDLLDSLGVEYDRVDHAPAMTMEDCKEVAMRSWNPWSARICSCATVRRPHSIC